MQETGNNQSQTYNLSIRLHADGFSFYSYNPTRTEPVAIEDYIYHEEESVAETLKKAIAQSAIVRKRNNPVVYGLVTGLSMQVPLECFRKEEAHALYRLTYAQEKTGKTYYNILPHLEIAQIFTVDCGFWPNRTNGNYTLISTKKKFSYSAIGHNNYVMPIPFRPTWRTMRYTSSFPYGKT